MLGGNAAFDLGLSFEDLIDEDIADLIDVSQENWGSSAVVESGDELIQEIDDVY